MRDDLHRLTLLPKRSLISFSLSAGALVACLCAGSAQARPWAPTASGTVAQATGSVHYSFANTDGYQASESIGSYPIVIDRDDASQPGTICWGVANKSVEAGTNFTKVPNTHVDFAAGQSSATVYVPIHDQGINGPSELARAYMYGCGMGGVASTPNQTITLLQNDPVPAHDPSNVLGYQEPTNGDPLQYADWYIFGANSAASLAARQYEHSNPAWSKAFDTLASTPGSGSVRFWMWNQPTTKIASTVEKWLANAEQSQPGTIVQMTGYNLVHGNISPSTIKNRYEPGSASWPAGSATSGSSSTSRRTR